MDSTLTIVAPGARILSAAMKFRLGDRSETFLKSILALLTPSYNFTSPLVDSFSNLKDSFVMERSVAIFLFSETVTASLV